MRMSPKHEQQPQQPSAPDNVQALLPLAEQLQRSIDDQLASPDFQEGFTQLDTVVNKALQAVAERHIEDAIDQLSPQQFAELYLRVRGDEALAEHLHRLQEIHTELLAREARLATMGREARISGKLRLEHVPADEVLSFGLFDPDHPDLATKSQIDNGRIRPLHRVLQVRLLDPAQGEAEVLNDTWVGPIWAEDKKSPLATPHTLVRLGSRFLNREGETLDPTVSLKSPLTIQQPDNVLTPPQIVGYVETLDHQLLLNGE